MRRGQVIPPGTLICKSCQGVYRQPRLLSCLHSFCTECLQLRLTKRGVSNVIACPVCCHQTTLTLGGVSGLKVNAFLQRISEECIDEIQRTISRPDVIRSRSPRHAATSRPLTYHEGVDGAASSDGDAGEEGKTSAPRRQYEFELNRNHGGLGRSVSPHRLRHQLSLPNLSRDHRSSSTTRLPPDEEGRNGSEPPASLDNADSLTQVAEEPNANHVVDCEMDRQDGQDSDLEVDRDRTEVTGQRSRVGVRLRSRPVSREASAEMLRLASRLQAQLMLLQGEALRITYAIDAVNTAVNDWRDQRFALRKQIEERCELLQELVRHQARCLLTTLDGRGVEKELLTEATSAKSSLRSQLQSVLHDVELVRLVQDMGTDQEIDSMIDMLCKQPDNLTRVEITTPCLTLEVPAASAEDIVSEDFGQLVCQKKPLLVYRPGSSTPIQEHPSSTGMESEAEPGNGEAEPYSPPPDLLSSNQRLTFHQFQTLQESVRQRRKDLIKEQHQQQEDSVFVFPGAHARSLSPQQPRSPLGSGSPLPSPPAACPSSRSPRSPPVVKTPGRPSQRARSVGDSPRVPLGVASRPGSGSEGEGARKTSATMATEELAEESVAGNLNHFQRTVLLPQDKRSRLDFLRESWKRRKTILMENDGFTSTPDLTDNVDKGETTPQTPEPQVLIGGKPIKVSRLRNLRSKLKQVRQHFRSASSDRLPKSPTVEDIPRRIPSPAQDKPDTEEDWTLPPRLPMKRGEGGEGGEGEGGRREQGRKGASLPSSPHHDQNQDGGLTKAKLQKLRDSMRRKTQKWRSLSIN